MQRHGQTLQERKEEYIAISQRHSKNERILNAIYYTLGFISTVGSSALALISTQYPKQQRAMVGTSFAVLFLNSVLNFGQIEKKIAKHRDMRIQYESLIMDIESAIQSNADEGFTMILLTEKHKLLMGYEINNTFCFD